VKEEGYVQPLSLGLFRSDYMVHMPPSSTVSALKQVEFNTIAASFGGLSPLVTAMHSKLYSSPGFLVKHPQLDGKLPPENSAVETLTTGLAASYNAYGPSKSSPALPLCILFIVQEGERNIFDQLALSTRLTTHHNIPIFRVNTSEILNQTSIPISNPSRPLIYTSPESRTTQFEVTTVYLRSFYAPTDYNSQRDWDARTHLERSAAIKCPTVLNQLSGCKKVQQVLSETARDHPSYFLPRRSPSIVEQLRGTFVPQYDLSSDPRGKRLALNPETAINHVLKPQREGGGNNIYKSSIPGFLSSIPDMDWKRWVLMELIQPPSNAKNTILTSNGEAVSGNVVGELGIFGSILWKNDGQILHNTEGGWLMRTKMRESNEGGVHAGFSGLDSILLF
jgi:glutathione synthase